MAAVELSLDKDWLRIKGAAFIASGDGDPSDDKATRLRRDPRHPVVRRRPVQPVEPPGPAPRADRHRHQVARQPAASLRTSKDEGQPNFVNPGVFILNGAADIELTPKLRGFLTTSYMRFLKTEQMEALLFQEKVRPNVGVEFGAGARYRPPLSDNIIIIGGHPDDETRAGLEGHLRAHGLFSIFLNARLQF